MKTLKTAFRITVLILLFSSQKTIAQWETLSPNTYVTNICEVNDTWYALEYHGNATSYFLYSNSKGQSWDTVPGFTNIFLLETYKDKILVSGVYNGTRALYLSEDMHQTWKELKFPFSYSPADLLLNDTAMYAYLVSNPGVESPVYRSLDEGTTWLPLTIDTENKSWSSDVNGGYGLCEYNDNIFLFAGRIGYFTSEDGGDTWEKINNGLSLTEEELSSISHAPMYSSSIGLYTQIAYELYKYSGSGWENIDYKTYVFDREVYINDWVEAIYSYRIPNIYAVRPPYMFAVGGYGPGGSGILYSIDNGKTWFQFPYWDYTNALGKTMKIDGGYLYVGFNNGFARISLTEAITHKIEKKKVPVEYPSSPEGMENPIGLIGFDMVEELLEEAGLDADEMTMEEIEDFIDDYVDDNSSSYYDLFSNSQPSTCNYMGMPKWSMNAANLKLFVRDVISRKKGLGPEVKVAINYVHSTDTTASFFGKNWRFEYEEELSQYDSTVVLKTGTGAKFYFTEQQPVITGGSTFSLSCTNKNNLSLNWTGTTWQLEKQNSSELHTFREKNSNQFILESISDAFEKSLTLEYDANNHLTMITDATGREYHFTYSGTFCNSITKPDGSECSFEYSSDSLLLSTTDFNNIITQYTYDSILNITSVDIGGKTTQFEYDYSIDSLGMVSSITDPEERVIQYSYTQIDSVNTFTNILYPNNTSLTYLLNDGRVTSITNTDGETKNIYYNSTGNIDSLIWYDGSSTIFNYNEENEPIYKKDRTGKISHYNYSEDGKISLISDVNLDTVSAFTYNTKNQLLSVVLPGNRTTSYTYDENGALASITNEEGAVHQFEYDEFGNLTTYTNPSGNSMTYSFDLSGMSPESQTDFNGNIYSFEYNDNGKLIEVTNPAGNSRTFEYDCCTQIGVTDENGNTISATRDATNRILEKTSAEGITYPINYDDNGVLSEISTPFGSTKTLKYNNNGKLESITDEEGKISYSYNKNHRLSEITDKKGNKTSFKYTTNNRLSEIIDASGNKTSYQYNNLALLNTYTNSRNQITGYNYDEVGNVTSKELDGTVYAQYGYNKSSKMISYEDSFGETTYDRNELGFVETINYPNGLSVSFEYDKNGNVTAINYPNGLKVSNTPDNLNRISGISWNTSSVTFDYDNVGNLLSEERNNNTTTLYEYNKDNTLLNIEHELNDSILASEEVVYEDGIITGLNIKAATIITHVPEAIPGTGSNELNQLTGSTTLYRSINHDADGNLTAHSYKDNILLAADYSHENLLTSLTTEEVSATIQYNAMRYPEKIIINETISYLYYDHKGRLLFETDESGNLLRNFIYRGKRLIAFQSSDNKTYFYHSNRHGNIIAISSETGDLENAYVYSGNGEMLGSKENVSNWFTFLGAFGAIRIENNYILTGARVYCPLIGRFMQRDPLGILTGTNPYLYAANNPIKGIDPLGLDEQETTVNTLDFDLPSDNEYGTAAGTANPYDESLPYRSNDWDTYGSALTNTLKEFSDHPVADLIPDCIGNPVSMYKAMDKLAEKDVGGALWQFVPFNNSMEAAGEYISEKASKADNSKSFGLGIFGQFNTQKTISCEL